MSPHSLQVARCLLDILPLSVNSTKDAASSFHYQLNRCTQVKTLLLCLKSWAALLTEYEPQIRVTSHSVSYLLLRIS